MKKLLLILLALTLVLSVASVASAATLPENGWQDDDGNYDGWTLNDDGSMTMVYTDGTGYADNRIWCSVEDSQNFVISTVVDFENNSRPTVGILGVIVALNSQGGDGNQFCVQTLDASGSWAQHDWMSATDCVATVWLARENGGNVKVTIVGKDNATPTTMELVVSEPNNNNLTLGMYDCSSHPQGGIATYTVDFSAENPPVAEPPATEPSEPAETKPAEPKPTQPKPTQPVAGNTPANSNTGLVIALVAVLIVAAAAVVIAVVSKKKA